MDSKKRMLNLLKSTGIYRLGGESAVEKEISTYAVYFDVLVREIEKLADNCFIDTLTYDGITAYRRLYKLPEQMRQQTLKELVKKRIAVTNKDFTVAGVKRCMASGGFDAELTEHFDTGVVTVKVLSDAGAFGTRAEKEAFLQECLPCHAKGEFIW